MGHFAPVRVDEKFTLDFDNRENFESHHYAFRVTEEEFDDIYGRIESEGVVYGSLPGSQDDMEINHRRGWARLLLEGRQRAQLGSADRPVVTAAQSSSTPLTLRGLALECRG